MRPIELINVVRSGNDAPNSQNPLLGSQFPCLPLYTGVACSQFRGRVVSSDDRGVARALVVADRTAVDSAGTLTSGEVGWSVTGDDGTFVLEVPAGSDATTTARHSVGFRLRAVDSVGDDIAVSDLLPAPELDAYVVLRAEAVYASVALLTEFELVRRVVAKFVAATDTVAQTYVDATKTERQRRVAVDGMSVRTGLPVRTLAGWFTALSGAKPTSSTGWYNVTETSSEGKVAAILFAVARSLDRWPSLLDVFDHPTRTVSAIVSRAADDGIIGASTVAVETDNTIRSGWRTMAAAPLVLAAVATRWESLWVSPLPADHARVAADYRLARGGLLGGDWYAETASEAGAASPQALRDFVDVAERCYRSRAVLGAVKVAVSPSWPVAAQALAYNANDPVAPKGEDWWLDVIAGLAAADLPLAGSAPDVYLECASALHAAFNPAPLDAAFASADAAIATWWAGVALTPGAPVLDLRNGSLVDHVNALNNPGGVSVDAELAAAERRARFAPTGGIPDQAAGATSAASAIRLLGQTSEPKHQAVLRAAITQSRAARALATSVAGLSNLSGLRLFGRFAATTGAEALVDDPSHPCACDGWNSVFSPGAYLVDLLAWLEAIPDGGASSLLDALASRRPDILSLRLSHDATEGSISHVSRVNDVLLGGDPTTTISALEVGRSLYALPFDGDRFEVDTLRVEIRQLDVELLDAFTLHDPGKIPSRVALLDEDAFATFEPGGGGAVWDAEGPSWAEDVGSSATALLAATGMSIEHAQDFVRAFEDLLGTEWKSDAGDPCDLSRTAWAADSTPVQLQAAAALIRAQRRLGGTWADWRRIAGVNKDPARVLPETDLIAPLAMAGSGLKSMLQMLDYAHGRFHATSGDSPGLDAVAASWPAVTNVGVVPEDWTSVLGASTSVVARALGIPEAQLDLWKRSGLRTWASLREFAGDVLGVESGRALAGAAPEAWIAVVAMLDLARGPLASAEDAVAGWDRARWVCRLLERSGLSVDDVAVVALSKFWSTPLDGAEEDLVALARAVAAAYSAAPALPNPSVAQEFRVNALQAVVASELELPREAAKLFAPVSATILEDLVAGTIVEDVLSGDLAAVCDSVRPLWQHLQRQRALLRLLNLNDARDVDAYCSFSITGPYVDPAGLFEGPPLESVKIGDLLTTLQVLDGWDGSAGTLSKHIGAFVVAIDDPEAAVEALFGPGVVPEDYPYWPKQPAEAALGLFGARWAAEVVLDIAADPAACVAAALNGDVDSLHVLAADALGPAWSATQARVAGARALRLRDALVHLHRRDGGPVAAVDSAAVSAKFLIDVNLGPDRDTSRVQEATLAVQGFVHRWMLGLESGPAVVPTEIQRTQWEWLRFYRTWEANRRVFLYPENWVDPSLRDTASAEFKQLRDALDQCDMSDAAVEGAFATFVHGLAEVARLRPVAIYDEADRVPMRAVGRAKDPPTHSQGERGDGIVHVFAQSEASPPTYYHRQYDLGVWKPWEPIASITAETTLIPVMIYGRIAVAWVEWVDPVPPPALTSAPSAGAGPTVEKLLVLHWTVRTTDGWSAPVSSRDRIPCSVAFQDPTPRAYVRATGAALADPAAAPGAISVTLRLVPPDGVGHRFAAWIYDAAARTFRSATNAQLAGLTVPISGGWSGASTPTLRHHELLFTDKG